MPFPSTGILDNFNRADENPLTASTWAKPSYTTFDAIKLVSNVAVPTTNNTNDNMAYWSLINFGPDMECYLTIVTKADSETFAICGVRYTSGGNGYKVDWDSVSTNIRLFRDDSGVRTQLGSSSAQAMSNGDSLGISAIGSTITAWYRASGGAWAAKITQTDATYTAAGRLQWGMWNNASGMTVDNLGGGNVVSAAMTGKSGYWGDV